MTFEGFSSYLAVILIGFVAFLALVGTAVVYIFRQGETQAVAGAQGTAQVSLHLAPVKARHQAVMQTS